MADARQRSMSNAPKFADRTQEQREQDARANAPLIQRARCVNSILTARYLKAKSIFDNYHEYDVDAAFVPTTTGQPCWREDADPWLRIQQTLPEFLEDYVRIIVDSGGEITGEGLQNLAVALVRVARAEWEGAGRDKSLLGRGFEDGILRLVERLRVEFKLPEAADADSEEGEGADGEDGEGGVEGRA
ncbi:hypothetical protein KVR01_003298 [Diaporthe batatas]|uniref:uncharacterized protein n=1 Tax=Diaporthe batatas TaxID=748121 RepID=UPI001D05A073|nr:uncharacterized protein KVR01_003298 [Diaporthe batatas]KAG8167609.1 hypothetical protein KVR01_003298 [Diaporthe batatas]